MRRDVERIVLEHVIGNFIVIATGLVKNLEHLRGALTETARDIALQTAWSLYGTPYVWGGDDPVRGFDCSGFIVEILKSVGRIPASSDYTADGLWGLFSSAETAEPYAGCLVFWAKDKDCSQHHVEMCINDRLSIGASGGGSKTRTEQDAIDQNAYIKVRPFRNRRGVIRFADPLKTIDKD